MLDAISLEKGMLLDVEMVTTLCLQLVVSRNIFYNSTWSSFLFSGRPESSVQIYDVQIWEVITLTS